VNFIESILSRLEELWPLVRVHSFQRGVKFRHGRDIALLEPGVHFAFWWFEEIVLVTTCERTVNLPTQSMTTADDVAVTFSANVAYEVTDAREMYTKLSDFEDSLNATAMVFLADKVRSKTWAELVSGQAELERQLREALTRRGKRWGVKFLDVGFTDMVKARVHRLYGDPVVE
jgi:regulator of protease activity HflC (stomatin/prohibitin superfamily)